MLIKQNNKNTNLEQLPCRILSGVGPSLAEKLARCGITTLQDLLFHLPFRYQRRTHVNQFKQLQIGDTVVLEGQITHVETKLQPRRSLLCYISDGSELVILRFFHFTEKQKLQMKEGELVRAAGEVRGRGYYRELIHPEYKIIKEKSVFEANDTFTPVYPTTLGLSQRLWIQLTDQALKFLENQTVVKEYLSCELLRQFELSELKQALLFVHRPPIDANVALLQAGQHPMQQRLAFEELLAHHLSLRKNRKKIDLLSAPSLVKSGLLVDQFLKQLPFSLTSAQQRVSQEIANDLEKSKPMLRLVQGDVGSGKTVVAALAALQAIQNKKQAALMAPTELLAEQHYANFQRWFSSLGVPVFFVTGKLKGKAREAVLLAIATESRAMIIGTHALFQDDVIFSDLALVVVDEQHRFGVQQRLALRDKAKGCPHQLIMSATPIPRTLAMVAYADLDQSIIDELPPGRIPIQTTVLPQTKREKIIERIRLQCQEKKQAYWICTLIEESETLQCQTAVDTYQSLQRAMPSLTLALVHGRLMAAEKQKVMERFRRGEIDLLVATTVIEVGVDVPNASLMIIENAERLGLSQLHQLRGRVGRGTVASHCVLLYQHLNGMARERLEAMRETQDGFVLAQRDLALRGPGEVLGTRQTGLVQFRVADLLRDQALIPKVQEAARCLLEINPEIETFLVRRWLGHVEQYAVV